MESTTCTACMAKSILSEAHTCTGRQARSHTHTESHQARHPICGSAFRMCEPKFVIRAVDRVESNCRRGCNSERQENRTCSNNPYPINNSTLIEEKQRISKADYHKVNKNGKRTIIISISNHSNCCAIFSYDYQNRCKIVAKDFSSQYLFRECSRTKGISSFICISLGFVMKSAKRFFIPKQEEIQ